MAGSGRQRYWTLNGDFLALKPTGVPRYARETTLALDALIGEGHPLAEGLSLDIVAPRTAIDLSLRAIPIRVVAEFDKPRLPQFWAQFQLPRHVKGGLVSFCNLAPVAISRHIVCIHDLHTRIMPGSYGRGFRLAHRLILPALGRTARRVTTVSGLSRDHLVEYAVAPREKIVVTYNGADHTLRWRPEASTLAFGPRPFVLCLGQDQAYKNMELVWRIAPQLDELGLDVYMAGNIGEDVLRSYGGEWPTNLRRLGRISDDDFAKALKSTVCFLFPSRIEGFGLPAVEAMSLGCPVVAADAACLPEICGEAALYAAPNDQRAWVDAVRRLLFSDGLRDSLIKHGYSQAGLYRWRTIAETYLKLMAEIDGLSLEPNPF